MTQGEKSAAWALSRDTTQYTSSEVETALRAIARQARWLEC